MGLLTYLRQVLEVLTQIRKELEEAMAQLSDFAAKAAEAEAEIDRIKAKLADGGMSAADEAAALEAVGKVVDDLKAV